jgi:multicomponent Na+:H+ antiporter subunit C
MTLSLLYGLTGAALVALGVHGVILHAHPLRRVLALNVAGAAVFLLLVSFTRRDPGVDAVPQAMVLTGIVVTVAATAVALTLARCTGRNGRDEDEPR